MGKDSSHVEMNWHEIEFRGSHYALITYEIRYWEHTYFFFN